MSKCKCKRDTELPAVMGKGYYSPYAVAKRTWEAEDSPWTFEQARDILLTTGGYFYCTPHYLIMGKAVELKFGSKPNTITNREEVLNIAKETDGKYQNCWHIWLLVGKVTDSWTITPYPLPWASWEISNDFRFYAMDRVRKIVLRKAKHV